MNKAKDWYIEYELSRQNFEGIDIRPQLLVEDVQMRVVAAVPTGAQLAKCVQSVALVALGANRLTERDKLADLDGVIAMEHQDLIM